MYIFIERILLLLLLIIIFIIIITAIIVIIIVILNYYHVYIQRPFPISSSVHVTPNALLMVPYPNQKRHWTDLPRYLVANDGSLFYFRNVSGNKYFFRSSAWGIFVASSQIWYFWASIFSPTVLLENVIVKEIKARVFSHLFHAQSDLIAGIILCFHDRLYK